MASFFSSQSEKSSFGAWFLNSGKAVSPGKGRRGIPCRESAPPFLQGFSVHPVRTLKRATGLFRPTAESLKAAYRTSPQLCQERAFAIEGKRTLVYVRGRLAWGAKM